jgi:hypothetical protein
MSQEGKLRQLVTVDMSGYVYCSQLWIMIKALTGYPDATMTPHHLPNPS